MKKKFAPPNYTQVPNRLLQDIPKLKDAQLRIMFVICRETFGFHKRSAVLSVSSLAKKSGLSRRHAWAAAEELHSFGYIKRKTIGRTFAYSINLHCISLPS